MRTLLMCLATALLLGCSQESGRDVVDTMSQRKALEAGRKAGEQIRAIRADQDKNQQEVEQ